MSIEFFLTVSEEEQTESEFESVGEADGVPYVVAEIPDVGSRAIIEYSSLIERVQVSLEEAGTNPASAQFDTTIVNWLKHHCDTLPVDGISLISKESDWNGWYDKTAPWFEQFEILQLQYDEVQARTPSMPLGTRPQVDMYLEDTLVWCGRDPAQQEDYNAYPYCIRFYPQISA